MTSQRYVDTVTGPGTDNNQITVGFRKKEKKCKRGQGVQLSHEELEGVNMSGLNTVVIHPFECLLYPGLEKRSRQEFVSSTKYKVD